MAVRETKATKDNTVSGRELRNRRLAFEAAVESIVLLENDGTLPISPGKIALFGAGAQYTIKGGSGSGEVNVRHSVSILEGLENAGFTVTTKGWLDRYDAAWRAGKDAFIRETRKKLFRFSAKIVEELMGAEYRYPVGDRITNEEIRESDTDTCLYVLSRQSGEGYDRKNEAGSFRLTDDERLHIRFCAENFGRFVLVLNTGAPVDLSPLEDIHGIGAVVYMNQPGMEGGNALAAVLTGTCTPSGKLAVTWAGCYEDYPFSGEFGPYAKDADHAAYKEGIYVGYRYFDSFRVKPRYPFGYGKSYTEFKRTDPVVTVDGCEVRLDLTVTNTGRLYAGREIVQVYVSCPQNGQAKEYQRLAAFAKTERLSPGESENLRLRFHLSVLSSYDEERQETYLEAGDYILRAGASSGAAEAAAKLTLARRVIVSRHRSLCEPVHPVSEWERSLVGESADYPALPELTIDPDRFSTVEYDYRERSEVFSEQTEEYLNSFSAEDRIRFCAGTGLFGGKKGFCTPGAVGHTTADYLERGIPNREMCDGPAGLRVQRRSTIDKKGKIKAVDAAISFYDYLPGFLRRALLGNPEKDTVLYQYVTGFPVAAALAQSWNTALLEKIGQAVSTEMTEYGVTWWLAPALNIVRNPLCGRNFEYYSEDPLLSGKLAAAVTKGVQEVPGNYVTIKHFAANNQEENRFFVSSDMDERTLREIYLRGFEIVVREAKPRAVMSAYNKINGVYCANNKGLCTRILRDEWGFDGIVMTDWLATGKGRADEAGCLEAGVDLIMPGGRQAVKALSKAYKKGFLSEAVLRRSSGRVLEQILNQSSL